jgi:hypothetical protein
MTTACCGCDIKDREIAYLRAVIALDSLPGASTANKGTCESIEHVQLNQQLRLIKQQLLLLRADTQYMNREVQSVFSWISRVITVFLGCCGRLGETTTNVIVETATKVGNNVSRLVFSKE